MESYRGTRSLQSFSPSWTDPEVLEKTLIGRKPLVDRLEELVIDGAGGPNKHQRLIVGARGSGKTHIIRVLRNRLWENEELKKHLLIIYLLEDELGVASFLDFVVRLLRAIVRWYPEYKELAKDLDALYDLHWDMQEKRAVQLLLAVAGDKDVLILIENLGITFDESKGFGRKGQQALRDLIQEYPKFMIFATSQALVEGTKDPDMPFFGFFKVIHLRRLKEDEALKFLEVITSSSGNKHLMSFLNTPKGRARMRAIYEFTGGNHRLLVSFYEFLTADSLTRLSEMFIKALGPLKPYYQEQMRSLSAQQQKIVQYLATERRPCNVKDIARNCLASSNTISRQLKDLLEKNFVSRMEKGRQAYYEVTETLFRICYEADIEQEGAPVRLFVDFLVNFYTAQELQIRWRAFVLLAEKLGNQGDVPFTEEAKFYARALELHYPIMPNKVQPFPGFDVIPKYDLKGLFQAMEQIGAYKEILDVSKFLGGKKDVFVLHAEASAYAHLGDPDKARETALQALKQDNKDVEAHLLLSDVLSLKDGTREAGLKHARRARELAPDNPQAMAREGKCLVEAKKFLEALEYLEIANKKFPDYAEGWYLAGRALDNLGRLKEAESHLRKALELESNNIDALESLGGLIGNAGRHKEALDIFQRLNDMAPDYSAGWYLSGKAFDNLGRLEEAESHLRKALELESNNINALESLGGLFWKAGKHKEALDIFQRLNEVAPDYATGWNLSGLALDSLGRLEEAESHFRKALELESNNIGALESLGILIGNAGRHKEALDLFQRLNEVAPDYANGWCLSGRALDDLGRLEEAESHLRKSIELDSNNINALEKLGRLIGNAGRHKEALDLFQRLNELAPDYTTGWYLSGLALYSLGRLEEAESHFRKTLELESNNIDALESIGILIGNAGRHKEALDIFQRLNEVAPDYANGWYLSGRALDKLGRLEEAESHLRKTLELESNNINALERLGILIGNAGRLKEALDLFQRLNELAPDYATGWYLSGLALYNLGRLEEAESHLRKTLKLEFNNISALESLGRLFWKAGKHKEALDIFQQLNKVAPDYATGWYLSGLVLYNLGRLEEAESHLRKTLELESNNISALESLGGLFWKAGKHKEALDIFQRLNEVAPDYATGWNLSGLALDILGRLEEAESHLRKALELESNNIRALESLGRLFWKAGKHKEALDIFQRLNEVAPDYATGWNLSGLVCVKLGRLKEAESHFRKTLELESKNIIALESLGRLFWKAEKYKEALDLFQRLNVVAPDYATTWYLLGLVCVKLGRLEEAESHFRKTLEIDNVNVGGWNGLVSTLLKLRRENEASLAFDRALELGVDHELLLNHRGEARRESGQYELAIEDYKNALQVNPKAVLPRFNIVSAMLALGRTKEALEHLKEALLADKNSEMPKGWLIVQSFQENLLELFEHAKTQAFTSYLESALVTIEKEGYLEQFEQSMPLIVFSILKDHQKNSEDRLLHIIQALEEIIGKRVSVSVEVLFLKVGIDYFKKQDKMALLKLSQEERKMFCKELGIENR